jgi:choline kinase
VDALVLAAGNGDRFHNGTRQSKLLQPLLGQPLILRTLETARDAGVRSVEVVLGYQADALRAVIERGAPHGVSIRFSTNPHWHLENGVSVLAARHVRGRRFALLMGDHVFEARVLNRLFTTRAADDESLLAVDRRPAAAAVAAEATKVRLEGANGAERAAKSERSGVSLAGCRGPRHSTMRITAIGKDLGAYDALDTGLFVCAPPLFEALETSRAAGDTTLSGGIRRLAARGLMRAVDIGEADWYDIDTKADLETAESLLRPVLVAKHA